MIIVSCIGIMIGSYGLMLTLAIMNGFEKATHEQLQSIHAQIIISAYGNPINMPALTNVLNEEFPEVIACSPYALQQVIIQNPHTDDISTAVALKGIDPETHTLVNNLGSKILKQDNGSPVLTTLLQGEKILIGQKLAEQLSLDIDDTVTLLFAPDEPRRKKITLSQKKVRIGGFFKTGIEEFDANLVFCSLAFLNTLFPESGATHVQLKLMPQAGEPTIIHKLKQRLNLEVYSWKELYPALVVALNLEKYVMFCILFMISLIAGMNIISLIFMLVYQKKTDCAILQAAGMRASSIQYVFLYLGGIVAGCASIVGILLALLTCIMLERYPFTLPDAYLITYLPVSWHISMPIMIFFLTLFIGIIATYIPLRRSEQIDITEILKCNS